HVFEGYGVDLAIAPFGGVEVPGPAEGRPSRLAEIFPAGVRSEASVSHELVNVAGLRDVLEAYQMHLVMDLAARRRAPDPGDARPGRERSDGSADGPIPGTSEFFIDEVAALLDCSQALAARTAAEAYLFLDRLPEVWAAVADRALTMRRARVFADVLGPTAAGVAEAVVPRVLPEAADLSLRRLRVRLEREVLAEDAYAAERRRKEVEKRAALRLWAGRRRDERAGHRHADTGGGGVLVHDRRAGLDAEERRRRAADGPAAGADPCRADPAAVGHQPPAGHRPPDRDRSAADDQWSGDRAGGGQRAADHRMPGAGAAGRSGRRPPGRAAGACGGGSLRVAVTDANGGLLATASRAELERIARRGCPDHPGDNATGACGCPVLGPPPAVDRYAPSPGQRRFGRTRDTTCRHRHCGQPVGRTDLDHVVPYGAGGPTDCENLCCLCRHHHRLKTHAPGWRFVLLPNGVLRVTTPGGIIRSTRPPGLRDRIEQRALPGPPPTLPEAAPF
ncbi:HNH endonuclease signature motif containing protein, partial [Blastococcus sp. CT_GayMR20]|uniref:HNH endonuclease signature motif containing protein n=1 Tax=Blastococcus sp. CT_GayMR20 TaxID=2559609 RepID=UPI001431231F